MSSLDDDLQRWREAGILDAATAARIAAFERKQAPDSSRPSVIEALVYLGAAILAVGVIILTGINWEELTAPARVAVAGVPAVLALLAGFALRSTGREELRRGAAVAWLLTVALAAATVAILASEGDWDENNAALAASGIAFAVALVLWAIAPSQAQVLGIVVTLGAIAAALGSRADQDNAAYVGLFMAILAAAAIVLTEVGLFRPRDSARLFAGALLAVGGLAAGMIDPAAWGEPLLFAAATVLGVLGIARASFAYLLMGIGVAFLGLISAIVRHVEDPTLAALALILAGAVLVAVVLLVARFRPWRGNGSTSPGGAA